MPKSVSYKANSIVFFKGDKNDSKIFILKSGKVLLKSTDIETGKEVQDLIKMGEFFGVKSALGKYPREETAVVLTDSTMLVFSVPEFEAVVLQNTRIIMKMLKVFSNQLRRIHKQVQNLLSTGEQSNDPESGLYHIGDYYLKNNRFPQAIYALKQYLVYYPSGQYSSDVTQKLQYAEARSQGQPAQAPAAFKPNPSAPVSVDAGGNPKGGEVSDTAKQYYNALSLFSQQRFPEALKEFQVMIDGSGDPEYEAKALYEMGRCYFSLQQYDKCIQHFTGLIQRYPKHPDLIEALFYVGNCYKSKGANDKAVGFYKKILTLASDELPVHRKAKKALKAMEGGA